uniref:hypothetical protein n=1 Tax=uncultured Erythrobacter sp. TaxID=263913 RepID=UPI0026107DB2|nr:hypothetical protein [uncultured Erythrobacter sp.]
MNKIQRIWQQKYVPVIVRRSGNGKQHRVRLPFRGDNREWLRNERRSRPVWVSDRKFWEIPKAWFNDFVERSLDRFEVVWIIQPYREQEVCASACLNAQGHECQCSCMGANHGTGNDGSWFEVSEAFAVKWGESKWACRLLEKK